MLTFFHLFMIIGFEYACYKYVDLAAALPNGHHFLRRAGHVTGRKVAGMEGAGGCKLGPPAAHATKQKSTRQHDSKLVESRSALLVSCLDILERNRCRRYFEQSKNREAPASGFGTSSDIVRQRQPLCPCSSQSLEKDDSSDEASNNVDTNETDQIERKDIQGHAGQAMKPSETLAPASRKEQSATSPPVAPASAISSESEFSKSDFSVATGHSPPKLSHTTRIENNGGVDGGQPGAVTERMHPRYEVLPPHDHQLTAINDISSATPTKQTFSKHASNISHRRLSSFTTSQDELPSTTSYIDFASHSHDYFSQRSQRPFTPSRPSKQHNNLQHDFADSSPIDIPALTPDPYSPTASSFFTGSPSPRPPTRTLVTNLPRFSTYRPSDGSNTTSPTASLPGTRSSSLSPPPSVSTADGKAVDDPFVEPKQAQQILPDSIFPVADDYESYIDIPSGLDEDTASLWTAPDDEGNLGIAYRADCAQCMARGYTCDRAWPSCGLCSAAEHNTLNYTGLSGVTQKRPLDTPRQGCCVAQVNVRFEYASTGLRELNDLRRPQDRRSTECAVINGVKMPSRLRRDPTYSSLLRQGPIPSPIRLTEIICESSPDSTANWEAKKSLWADLLTSSMRSRSKPNWALPANTGSNSRNDSSNSSTHGRTGQSQWSNFISRGGWTKSNYQKGNPSFQPREQVLSDLASRRVERKAKDFEVIQHRKSSLMRDFHRAGYDAVLDRERHRARHGLQHGSIDQIDKSISTRLQEMDIYSGESTVKHSPKLRSNPLTTLLSIDERSPAFDVHGDAVHLGEELVTQEIENDETGVEALQKDFHRRMKRREQADDDWLDDETVILLAGPGGRGASPEHSPKGHEMGETEARIGFLG